jgi:hypothetical protein
MGTNDVTGDRLVTKIDTKNLKNYQENMVKIFGERKETNGGWKYSPDTNGSVITSDKDISDKVV